MSQRNGHFSVSGTKIGGFGYKTSCFFALHGLVYTHPSMATILPSLPGSPTFLPGPNFLRPACPYPGCQLSSFAGSCPMENIPAGYWLILSIKSYWPVLYAFQFGTLRWTFSQSVPHTFQLFCHSWIQPSATPLRPESNHVKVWFLMFLPDGYTSCICGLLMSPNSFASS